MAKLEVKKMLAVAVAAAEEKQALDLRILELDPAESGLTDYFLVMSGANIRQMQTLSDEIELQLKRQFGDYANSREGYRQGEWILLDYVDFVVHIFSEEKRAFYDIERLRKSAHQVSPEELRAALTKKTAAARQKAAGKESAGEEPMGAEPEIEGSAGKVSKGKKSAVTGKKTAGTRKVTGMPLGAKSQGAKRLAKKSTPVRKSGKTAVKGTSKKSAGAKPVGKKRATGSASTSEHKGKPKARKRG